MQHRVVIRHGRRPWGWIAAAVAGALVLLGAAGYAGYRIGVDGDGTFSLEEFPGGGEPTDERRRLARELRAARDELAGIKGKTAFDARSCELDTQACEAVRHSVGELEAQVAELREQLVFYRNVAAPEQEVRAGVRVMRLALESAGVPGAWEYELVLVQPTRRDRTAAGLWDLKIAGMLGKQMRTLALADLRSEKPPDRAFSFRSFQEFGGHLKLPAGFLPSRVTVTLRVQDGKETAEVEESFDWARVATAKE